MGRLRSHRRRSIFHCFSGAGLPFREATQLPRERIIITLTINLSPAVTRGIIDIARSAHIWFRAVQDI